MQSLIEHEVIHICHFTWATVNVQYYIKKYKTGYSNADLNYVMVIVGTSNLEEKKRVNYHLASLYSCIYCGNLV